MANNPKNVQGFAEAEELMKQLPQKIEDKLLQAATMAGVRALAKQVKIAATVGTEEQSPASKQYKRLKQNIKTSPLKTVMQKGRRGARVYTGNAFWGLFLEFGTRYITARPWFRPAVDGARANAINAMKEGLGRGIEREAKKLSRLK